jgi:biopolymer transport protein ExbD
VKFVCDEPENPELNVVSFIDILLMLLVFFIMSTTFVRTAHIAVTLPRAAVGRTPMRPGVVIGIDREGRYYVDGEPLGRSGPRALHRALARYAGDRRSLPVTIRADARVDYQAVVTAMSVAGSMGFAHLNLVTTVRRRRPRPPPP